MKLLALITLNPDAALKNIQAHLVEEIKGSWSLYQAGILRDAYATDSPSRVVFVLEADSIATASSHLAGLPLVAAGQFDVEIVELKPFVNWSMLFAAEKS